MRGIQKKFYSLYQFNPTQIAAASGVNYTVAQDAVPQDRLVSRVFLRVRSDLVMTGSTSAKLAINSSVSRRAFFNALISSVAVTMPGHPLDPQVVQTQGLGELVDSFGRLGILPTCPQLFGEGNFYSQLAQASRAPNITPAGTNGSHFISLEIPIIDQRYPGAGQAMYLSAKRLNGLAVNFTMGTLSFTDLNGTVVAFPTGTGSAAGVTSVELVAETYAANGGQPVNAWPPQFAKLSNGTQAEATLNPQGGAVALAVVRIPTATADSVDYITRTYAFTDPQNLNESAETSFTPKLYIDGAQPSDVVNRGFEYSCGLDLIDAMATAQASAHQLRATNTATVGDAYKAPSFYVDSGVPLVWNAPDGAFFESLSFGLHRVVFPNSWVAIGNRDIYTVIFPIVPGADNSKAITQEAVTAGIRGGNSFWERLKSILPNRG